MFSTIDNIAALLIRVYHHPITTFDSFAPTYCFFKCSVPAQHFCFWRATGSFRANDENIRDQKTGCHRRRISGLQCLLPIAPGGFFHADADPDRNKRGGIVLAMLTLVIWTLPACILMGGFSFFIAYINERTLKTVELFRFVAPMTVGFLAMQRKKHSKSPFIIPSPGSSWW